MSAVTETINAIENNKSLHELEGWMVVGIVTEGGANKARSVPVIASSAATAMALSAHANPNFQPVGVMSETEIKSHLSIIQEHRRTVLHSS